MSLPLSLSEALKCCFPSLQVESVKYYIQSSLMLKLIYRDNERRGHRNIF